MAITIPLNIQTLFQSPITSMWLSNATLKNEPDLVRLGGLSQKGADLLNCYIPKHYASPLISNFKENKQVAIILCNIETYESYQLKGVYLSHRTATQEEENAHIQYVSGFTAYFPKIGLPSSKKAFDAFVGPECLTISVQIKQLFEQTPKIGTGEKIKLDETNSDNR